MAPPVHNADGKSDDTSIHDLLIELMGEVRGIRGDLHKQGEVIEKLMNWKTGGETPENGIDIRMDRIERAHKSVGTVAWSAITGAAGALGIWVWTQIVGKNHS